MQIVVMSDSHGDFFAVQELVKRYKDDSVFIHLGDGLNELSEIIDLYPDVKVFSVSGNCDFVSGKALFSTLQCEEVRIFYTHGHVYGVKYATDKLLRAAQAANAQVALFGHTHQPLNHMESGVLLVNPGSLGQPRGGRRPSYAVLEVDGARVSCRIEEL